MEARELSEVTGRVPGPVNANTSASRTRVGEYRSKNKWLWVPAFACRKPNNDKL